MALLFLGVLLLSSGVLLFFGIAALLEAEPTLAVNERGAGDYALGDSDRVNWQQLQEQSARLSAAPDLSKGALLPQRPLPVTVVE